MDPITLSLIAAAIPAVIGLGKSAYQGYQAKQLAKTQRPEYNIPQAATEALNSARYQAGMTKLPGQNQLQQQIDTNTASAIANLKDVSSSGAGLGSNVASIYRGNMGAQNQLGIAGANNWLNNQGILRSQLGNMALFQGNAFDINKYQPYLAKKAAESALREGSFRNLSAAGTDIARAGMGYGMLKQGQPDEEDDGQTYADPNKLGKDQIDPNTVAAVMKYLQQNPQLATA